MIVAYNYGDAENSWQAIAVIHSMDNGDTWSEPVVLEPGAEANWGFADPTLIRLSSGIIQCWYNARDNYICFKQSTDDGFTWGERERIASWRPWEPFPVQLPSGEIQVFYSHEGGFWGQDPLPQDIKMIRSMDGGETWSSPQVIAWAGQYARDGTPCALVLQNGQGILVVFESLASTTSSPAFVWSSMSDNWDYPVFDTGPWDRRWDTSICAESPVQWLGWPWMLQLDSGEIVLLGHAQSPAGGNGDCGVPPRKRSRGNARISR